MLPWRYLFALDPHVSLLFVTRENEKRKKKERESNFLLFNRGEK